MLSIAPAYIVVSSPVPARMPGSQPSRMTLFFLPVFGPVWLLRRCHALLINNQGTVQHSSAFINLYNTNKILRISVCGWQVFTLKPPFCLSSCNRADYEIISEIVSHVSLLSPVNLAINCSIQFFCWIESFALVKNETTSLELDRINSWPLAKTKARQVNFRSSTQDRSQLLHSCVGLRQMELL